MNSILGMFGFAVNSIEMVDDLARSNKIVETMQKRNELKRKNASNKFIKKSSKRISSSVLAASTIGTVAVVLVVSSLEVIDYCDEKRELLAEQDLLFDTNSEFDYQICLKEAGADSGRVAEEIKNSASSSVQEAWGDAKDYSDKKWNEITNSLDSMYDSTSTSTRNFWDSMTKWMSR